MGESPGRAQQGGREALVVHELGRMAGLLSALQVRWRAHDREVVTRQWRVEHVRIRDRPGAERHVVALLQRVYGALRHDHLDVHSRVAELKIYEHRAEEQRRDRGW